LATLVDGFGRTFPYLRLSLTEACNFRCSYCLPDGYRADGRPGFLTLGEIERLMRAFAELGMCKVRLTGGEPSLRKDLPAIIEVAAATPGVRTVALTTNGALLLRNGRRWRQAGLTRLNVSVDSLDPQRFRTLTGHARFDDVIAGVDMALGLGFESVKLNAVLLRGMNDDELPAWFDYLRDRPLTVRFIELMRVGDNEAYFERHHVRADVLEQRIVDAGWTLTPRAPDAGPAREYAHPGSRGRIGIIAPYSKDFCVGCNRLRVTARGDLRLCLFGELGIPLRPLLQSDADHEALMDRIVTQLGVKAAGHDLHRGRTGSTRHLASIGG
jgi:cyclic pyranopterin phosphate synthase